MSEAAKRRAPPKEYERTPEIREKTASSLRGRRYSDERRENIAAGMRGRARTHGCANHPHYRRWHAMMYRCYSPVCRMYRHYGERGIAVCDEWHDVRAFVRYCDEVLGPKPPGYSIDRIDNDGDYEPGNVRWASPSEQIRNRRTLR